MALVSTTRDGQTYLLKKGNNLLETGSDIVKLPEGIGCVDLGTKDWTFRDKEVTHFAFNYFSTQRPSSMEFGSGLCSKYIMYPTTHNELVDKEIYIRDAYYGAIAIRDDDYTNPADFKASLSGVLLFYKKAST